MGFLQYLEKHEIITRDQIGIFQYFVDHELRDFLKRFEIIQPSRVDFFWQEYIRAKKG
jgi:hypothetical protein